MKRYIRQAADWGRIYRGRLVPEEEREGAGAAVDESARGTLIRVSAFLCHSTVLDVHVDLFIVPLVPLLW